MTDEMTEDTNDVGEVWAMLPRRFLEALSPAAEKFALVAERGIRNSELAEDLDDEQITEIAAANAWGAMLGVIAVNPEILEEVELMADRLITEPA